MSHEGETRMTGCRRGSTGIDVAGVAVRDISIVKAIVDAVAAAAAAPE